MTIQPSVGQDREACTFAGGGCTWTTDPFSVSGTIALIFASGQNPPISAIDRFLRLIGRGIGTAFPLSTSISASSSDSSRHPRATSAAQSVLLPEPGGAGSSS